MTPTHSIRGLQYVFGGIIICCCSSSVLGKRRISPVRIVFVFRPLCRCCCWSCTAAVVVCLWFLWSLSQGAFRYLLTPNPDHILPSSVVGFIYAEAHSPRARLLRGWRANGFCGRSTATAFRDKSSADLAAAEEDLPSQMKRISAQKHTRSGGGRGMNGLWFWAGFYTHTLDGSNDVQ